MRSRRALPGGSHRGRAREPFQGSRNDDAGLTLVELMITMMVASMVASSTFVFFAGQQKVYETQGKLLNIQQNLWGAMEVVARHVRAAGIGMANCVRPDSDFEGPDTGDPPPGTIGVVPGMPAPGAAPQTGVRVAVAGVATRIPPLWVANGVNGDPDMITVAYGTNTFGNQADSNLTADVRIGRPMTDPVQTVPDVYQPFPLPGGLTTFILLVDAGTPAILPNLDRGCTLFQLTGIAGNQLDHAANAWNPGADLPGMVPFTYPAGIKGGVRNFGQMNWVQFFVDRTGSVPRLMMNRLETASGPQILADGIEDLQIAYACDISPPRPLPANPWDPTLPPDGTLLEGPAAADPGPGAQPANVPLRSGAADEWVFNTTGEAIRPDCNHPSAVRITLIARSRDVDSALGANPNNHKPWAEDGMAGPVDQLRHRLISTTVSPRNRE